MNFKKYYYIPSNYIKVLVGAHSFMLYVHTCFKRKYQIEHFSKNKVI